MAVSNLVINKIPSLLILKC